MYFIIIVNLLNNKRIKYMYTSIYITYVPFRVEMGYNHFTFVIKLSRM